VRVHRHSTWAGDNEHSCAETIQIAEKFEHPNYNGGTMQNDITLLRLSQPVGCVDSIPMPLLDDGSYSVANMPVTVAGWGVTSEGGSMPDVLHSVDLTLLTNAQCETYGYAGQIADSMICAIGDLEGGEDSCQGDSGGPLFVQQARAIGPSLPRPRARRRLARALSVTPAPPIHAPLTPTPDPLLGWAGRGGHHRRRCLMGLRLRTEGRRRRLHARLLVPSLDRGDERCGCGQVPACASLPTFIAASPARATGDPAAALPTSRGACGAFRSHRDGRYVQQ